MQVLRITKTVEVDDFKAGEIHALDFSQLRGGGRTYLEASLQRMPEDVRNLLVSLAHEIVSLYPRGTGEDKDE